MMTRKQGTDRYCATDEPRHITILRQAVYASRTSNSGAYAALAAYVTAVDALAKEAKTRVR